MPLYKFVGNKILSKTQNILLRTKLSEFHSGYRAYNVNILKEIPFLLNSNDFHFDTEIIIQLFNSDYRIMEVPIPTYYGDEICYVNGIIYAINVIISTLKYRLHKMGVIYDAKFSTSEKSKYTYKKSKFSSHSRILDLVKADCGEKEDVLDVGCGEGSLSEKIAGLGHDVTGIDINESEGVKSRLNRFIKRNINEGLNLDKTRKYDVIIFADILEHVKKPEKILVEAWHLLKQEGKIMASTGNVAHIYIRLGLLFGKFNYKEKGILDRDHSRLFTISSFKKMFKMCGYKIERKRYCPIPFELIFRKWRVVANILSYFNMFLIFISRRMFAYQIVLELQKEKIPTKLLREKEIIETQYSEWVPDKHLESTQNGISNVDLE